jgi:hypothetical protein
MSEQVCSQVASPDLLQPYYPAAETCRRAGGIAPPRQVLSVGFGTPGAIPPETDPGRGVSGAGDRPGPLMQTAQRLLHHAQPYVRIPQAISSLPSGPVSFICTSAASPAAAIFSPPALAAGQYSADASC